jgi:hypothetical protein
MCDNCQLLESNGYKCLLHAPGTPLEECSPAHAHGITWGDWETRRWSVLRCQWLAEHPDSDARLKTRPLVEAKSPAAYGVKSAIPNYRQFDRHKRGAD